MIHPGRQITPILTRKGPDRQFIWRVSAALILALNILALTVSQAHAQLGIGGPTAAISGSYTLSNGTFLPGFFTWGDAVTFTGSGWFANDTLTVHMFGPQNQPGVTATDTILGTIFTDGSGKLVAGPNTTLKLAGIRRSREQPPTLRPGFYSVWAQRPPPTTFQPPVASAANNINLSPRTVPLVAQFPNYILWDKERGARDGQLGDFSPEREDPEYVSAWDERPVSIYATVAPTGPDGGNQPAFVSHADYPGTHFAHDLNLLLVPDPQYKWIIADANYDPKSGATAADSGRIEWEWETQNGGSPYQYGQGTIGVPLWVTPTAGDRIFTVGRWVMDNGHPDQGDRTEIHPGRMIATMRKRNTAVTLAPAGKSVFTRASQVDVFVSGHGGGANMYPDQLESLLNNVGIGGGSLLSLLSSADLATYEASGPTSSITAKALVGALSSLGFINGSADQILPIAGPSGLGWLNGGEFRPVNDMDYDFDVPLPRIPAGATKINVTVITHAEHATGVNEVITYTNPNSDGLPTVAHIHLPYRGADSGIYARTYYFYWDKFSPPGNHYRVQLDEIAFFEHSQTTVSAPFFAARNMMFADVCGQWTFLTAHDPDKFLSGNANAVAFPVTPFDVFLDPQDTLRVFTQGYDQEPIDQLFGAEVGKPTYDVGFDVATLALAVEVNTFLQSYGENVDLGGALFDDTIAPGLDTHGTDIIAHANTGYFFEGFSVKYLKRPPVLTTAVSPPTMGVVCVGGSNSQDVLVTNTGESDLVITSVSTVGAGYSVLAGLPTPVTLAAGATVDLTVTFKPGAPGQGAGILSIVSNDPLQPTATINLTGSVAFALGSVTAGTTRTPTLTVGATTTWPVIILNQGGCTLNLRPSITGTGFSMILPAGYFNIFGVLFTDITVAPGGTNTDLTVKFVCPSVSTKFVGTLALSGNDPVHPITTLTFGAEGVPVGMRVLVLGADGAPCPMVDDIGVKSSRSKVNAHLRNVPLTSIEPPASWAEIRYHYMTALPPTADGEVYQLRVQVGNRKQVVNFALAPGEFRQLVITLP